MGRKERRRTGQRGPLPQPPQPPAREPRTIEVARMDVLTNFRTLTTALRGIRFRTVGGLHPPPQQFMPIEGRADR